MFVFHFNIFKGRVRQEMGVGSQKKRTIFVKRLDKQRKIFQIKRISKSEILFI